MFNKLTLALLFVALWLNADAGSDGSANPLALGIGAAGVADLVTGR
ncbi:MAG: hypothetical protein R3D59_06030 [Paracoccaceae bacterium]|nr:hypothetical protein [Maritimibacter sp.]